MASKLVVNRFKINQARAFFIFLPIQLQKHIGFSSFNANIFVLQNLIPNATVQIQLVFGERVSSTRIVPILFSMSIR